MSRRTLQHPIGRLAKAQQRMAPGGLLWSESPIPRRYSPRVPMVGQAVEEPPPVLWWKFNDGSGTTAMNEGVTPLPITFLDMAPQWSSGAATLGNAGTYAYRAATPGDPGYYLHGLITAVFDITVSGTWPSAADIIFDLKTGSADGASGEFLTVQLRSSGRLALNLGTYPYSYSPEFFIHPGHYGSNAVVTVTLDTATRAWTFSADVGASEVGSYPLSISGTIPASPPAARTEPLQVTLSAPLYSPQIVWRDVHITGDVTPT